ncbi:Wzz/FepE/Etk N-terminal domain-containing protein [Aureimonas mangrovi]|uniref:Wzz/FepE/Etk N-terminal domain-containing protein n=1 Tax=Aureimonas mangrovi TaxID=2758041 RepID=UPI001FEB3C7D|nr:Wzz/FepE/Etk N-terminal domain-containing protein [Aureimonas mangrovi]
MAPHNPHPIAAMARASRSEDYIDLERLWTIARRNLKLVIICTVLAMALGLVYLRMAPPEYSAQTRILVDDSIGQVVGDFSSSVPANMQLDARISSQMEVLRSMRLALAVVDSAGLAEDETFLNPPSSPVSTVLAPVRRVVAFMRGPQEPSGRAQAANAALEGREPRALESATDAQSATEADPRRQLAALMLQRGLSVSRVERSSVIGVSFRSHDPELAYRVTQAYADAFLQEQLLANVDASGRATGWMEARLAQLGEDQRRAALAVEQFRANNNLSVARGELISEQRLAELTGQLALAQSEVAQARARSDQLAEVVASGPEEAFESAAFASAEITDSVVQQLRGRYLDMSRRIDQITQNFDENHPQAVQLRRQRDELSAQLFRELQQLASRYRNEFQVAQSRLGALESALAEQTGQNSEAGGALVELRELEQEAQTLNQIYGSFLTRYEETVQRESFPVSNLRVISAPTEPERPVGPRFGSTMAVFAALGLMLGCGAGALREFNERSFRTGDEVSRHLGLRFLGYLPLLPGSRRPSRWSLGRRKTITGPAATEAPDTPIGLQTAFAETLRNVIHASADPSGAGGAQVLGVLSVLPGEGKTTVATHLAHLLARTGSRTILIDGDFRRPALSRSLKAPPKAGLADAVRGQDWRPLLQRDEATGLAILPIAEGRDSSLGSVILSAPGMAKLLGELRAEFDHIIVDLPPIGPVVDAKAFAPFADSLLLVLRWGETPRALVQSALSDDPEITGKLVGALLTATDLDDLRRYGDRGTREHAYQSYQSYYHTN